MSEENLGSISELISGYLMKINLLEVRKEIGVYTDDEFHAEVQKAWAEFSIIYDEKVEGIC
jgi:hypothetical protein